MAKRKSTKKVRENIRGAKEEFKFAIKKGKVRSDNQRGRSLTWANRVEEKKAELGADGAWQIASVRGVPASHCEFCNHEITWRFKVRSVPAKGEEVKELEIGSECVKYFTSLEAVIEQLLVKIRFRKYILDANLKARKLLEHLKENKEDYRAQELDWEFYGKTKKTNPLEIMLDMIKKEKKPRVLERAMVKLGISTKEDWYKFSPEEEQLRLDVRDIDNISGNEITWKLDQAEIPEYPTVFPIDFA